MKSNKPRATGTKAVKASGKGARNRVQWLELGEVAVDSGQIVLCDPAYITDVDGEKFYDQLMHGGEHVEKPFDGGGILNGAKISNTWGKRYLGLKLPSFGGDGVFPIYGTFNGDGRLAAVCIDLNENRWESFQGERITPEEFDALVAEQTEVKQLPTQTSPAAA